MYADAETCTYTDTTMHMCVEEDTKASCTLTYTVHRQVQSMADRQTHRQTYTQIDWRTDRQPGRLVNRQIYAHCKVCPTIKCAMNLFFLTILMLQISSDTRLLELNYSLFLSTHRWSASPLLRLKVKEDWGRRKFNLVSFDSSYPETQVLDCYWNEIQYFLVLFFWQFYYIILCGIQIVLILGSIC